MDYVRVGGVCLLLMVIAAALPVNVLAQAPQESANGAAPIISQSLLSESSAQGETISAETLAKRNSGLKPLGTKSSSAASGGQTSGQSQAPISTSPAATAPVVSATTVTATPSTESSAPTSSSPATETQSTSQATSTPAETSSSTAAAASVTPAQIVQEPAAVPSSSGSAAESQSVVIPSTTVTPPENVSPGTVVSGNETAGNATTFENVSQNGTALQLPPENASENSTETQSSEATSEENNVGTDRIWREGINPLDYTWTPQSFSGFFYDLKNNVGTERLTIKLQKTGRSVDSGDLTYSTDVNDTDFEFNDWGKYQVIGFMAEKYFAGYKAGDVSDTDRSLINDGQLRRVLIDSDNESTLTTGSALPLDEGYELRIKQIDINGNKVFLSLAKDGDEVDSKVVSPESGDPKSSTYKYEVDITGEKTPIVLAHISNVFASTESDLVTVDGLFQISDTYNSVESGDKYGKMKVTSLSETGVEMDNEDSFSLRRGSTTSIFGNVGFQVADADVLRFAPVVERTGSYDVRGTVIDPSLTDEFKWSPYNFEGFYYDIDDDVGTENLTATITGGNKINEKDLVYTTNPQPVKFKFADWGKYDVIGFMADKFFAGYNDLTEFTDAASGINEGQLRKVLLDSDDSQTIASGSVLSLQEGYELRIKQVDLNGNKVYMALARDGKEIDSKVVTPSSDPKTSNYMYKVDMGSEKDVPMITAHIQSVFQSTESSLATVDAIFQVSDSPESVEEGEVHGKMKVDSLGSDGITMKNDGTISLGRGRVVDIMENLRIEVADNARRLMAPIATKAGEGSQITLSIPVAVVNRPVSISAKSGTEALTGVQISVNGSNIGTTDITGSISYTPDSTGTFSIIARKIGYLDSTASMTVTTASEATTLAAIQEANATLFKQLTLNAPAEVVKGENFLITVVEGINQTPVDNALISLDGVGIGNTNVEGLLTYSAKVTGEHALKAEKEGFNSTTRTITVTSSLKVVNLTVPEVGYVSQAIKISALVQNVGNVNDSRMLELKVNDTVVDSKNVTVNAGKNTTVDFSYKPMEPGLYRFGVDDVTRTVNVEKAQSSNWLIALILVLLIAIGAGFYLHQTGELDKLQKQVKKMMQGQK